jgi:hypothetical protein
VEAVWPPNGTRLQRGSDDATVRRWTQQWLKRPLIELTFDRPMAEAELDAPDPWLRVWRLTNRDEHKVDAERLELARVPEGDVDPVLHEPGTVAQWTPKVEERERPSRWLIQVRAEDPDSPIHEAGPPGQLLDADFRGTGLTADALEALWNGPGAMPVPDAFWDDLPGTDSLEGPRHSGDGSSGGRLQSWFAFEGENA